MSQHYLKETVSVETLIFKVREGPGTSHSPEVKPDTSPHNATGRAECRAGVLPVPRPLQLPGRPQEPPAHRARGGKGPATRLCQALRAGEAEEEEGKPTN